MLRAIAQPFGWLLLQLYAIFENYGVAVILFAFTVKVILLPFQMKSKRGMMQQSVLQPKLKELEKKHGANKQKYNEEVAKLYKEEGVNPASGCIWSLIPFPILLALYQVIRNPLTSMMGIAQEAVAAGGALYERIKEVAQGLISSGSETAELMKRLGLVEGEKAGGYIEIAQTQFIGEHLDSFNNIAGVTEKLREIDFRFLGMDMGEQPVWNFLWTTDWSNPKIWAPGLGLFLIPLVTGVLTFLTSKVSTKLNTVAQPEGQSSMKMMTMLMPLMTVYFGFIVPAALGVYWIANSVFGVAQDVWLHKRYSRIIEAENAEKNERRRAREAELEAKRLETERKKAENATMANPNTSKRKQQTTERQEQITKAVEWEKKNQPPPDDPDGEPARVGPRRYARGRAYDPDRFSEGADDSGEREQDETGDESTDEIN
ncbi:MAG: membrane protein insertase YidC [Oscillospiraceae bacterium]|jgi:YidC/Oxa1 family membrane protein insertase|nr:membrane protein insertase YidC [Oscillospiraceae bacterium]